MKVVVSACAIVFLAGALNAGDIVDNPGFCDATSGEQELADLVYLSPRSIDSHLANCAWDAELEYTPGLKTQVRATCYDGSEPFASNLEISVNSDGRVTVFGDSSTGLPEYYFPCARWGLK